MGPLVCPKTSVRNYHYLLLNNPEEQNSHCLDHLKHLQGANKKCEVDKQSLEEEM
jgi:hypothetical protein